MSEVPNDELGPIDYVVIEFPGRVFNRDLAPDLIALVDAGLVHIVDLLFLHKEEDGAVTVVELDDAAPEEAGLLATVECDVPGLLTDDDIAAVAEALDPGTGAALIVWENLWAAPLSASIRRLGGQMVASGRIPVSDLLESIEAADRGES